MAGIGTRLTLGEQALFTLPQSTLHRPSKDCVRRSSDIAIIDDCYVGRDLGPRRLASQGHLAVHAARHCQDARALPGVQPLAAVRFEGVWTDNHGHQSVRRLESRRVCNVLNAHSLISTRSEVVGRPLAALLSNDGARVFSVDLDGIQEFTKRKTTAEGASKPSFHPHHLVQTCKMSLEQCLAVSDVVVAGVSFDSCEAS